MTTTTAPDLTTLIKPFDQYRGDAAARDGLRLALRSSATAEDTEVESQV